MFKLLSSIKLNRSSRTLVQPIIKLQSSNFSISNRTFNSQSTEQLDMTEGETLLYNKLKEAFQPHHLKVTDVSGGCGSMYSIELKSEKFKGVRMVGQHRLINEVLKEDIVNMHGLQLRTSE